MLLTAATLLIGLASPAAAQNPRGVSVRAGVGIVASTPLVTDEVAGADVRYGVRPSPQVLLAVRQPIRPDSDLELRAGWTWGRLAGSSATGDWTGPDVSVGHLSGLLVVPLISGIDGRVGAGILRYFADDRGLFRGGGALRPMLEAGAGAGRGIGGFHLVGELTGQAHRFTSETIQDLRGTEGTVLRGAFTISASFGGGR